MATLSLMPKYGTIKKVCIFMENTFQHQHDGTAKF